MRTPLSQSRALHAAVLALSLGVILAGCRWFPAPHGPHHPPGTTTTTAGPTTTASWPGSSTTASWPSSTTTTTPGPTTTTTRPCPGQETTTTEPPTTLPPTTNTTRLPNSTTTSWPATTLPPSTTTTSWPTTTLPPTTNPPDTTDTTDPDTTDTTGYGTGGIVFELSVLIDDCPEGLLPLIDGAVCQESEQYSCTSLDGGGFAEITGFGSRATIHVFPTDPSIICPDTTFVRDDPDWNFEWQWLTLTCTRA